MRDDNWVCQPCNCHLRHHTLGQNFANLGVLDSFAFRVRMDAARQWAFYFIFYRTDLEPKQFFAHSTWFLTRFLSTKTRQLFKQPLIVCSGSFCFWRVYVRSYQGRRFRYIINVILKRSLNGEIV